MENKTLPLSEKTSGQVLVIISLILIGGVLFQYVAIYLEKYWGNYLCMEDDGHDLGHLMNYYHFGLKHDLNNKFWVKLYPLGYRLLFAAYTYFGSPFSFIQLTEIICYLLTVFLLWRIGKHLDGYGLALMNFYFAINFFPLYSRGGAPHTFNMVLMAYFIYTLLKKSLVQSAFAILLQMMLYPVLIVVSIPTYATCFLFKDKKDWLSQLDSSRNKIAWLAILFLFVVFLMPSLLPGDLFKHRFSYHNYLQGHGVEKDILPGPHFQEEVEKSFILHNTSLGNILFTVLCLVITFCFSQKIFNIRPLLILYGMSITGYLILCRFAFVFWGPNRIISIPLSLLSIIISPLIIMKLTKRIFPKYLPQINLIIPIVFIIVMYTYCGTVSKINSGLKHGHPYFCYSNKDLNVFKFFQSLPSGTLVAGHPLQDNIINGIPLYSHQNIFLSQESHVFIYLDYLKEMNTRTDIFFYAYYAVRMEELLRLVKDYNVTHLLIYKRHMQGEIKKNFGYYPEFDAKFKPYLQNLTSGQLMINRLPVKCFVYEDDNWKILDLKMLAAAMADAP